MTFFLRLSHFLFAAISLLTMFAIAQWVTGSLFSVLVFGFCCWVLVVSVMSAFGFGNRSSQ